MGRDRPGRQRPGRPGHRPGDHGRLEGNDRRRRLRGHLAHPCNAGPHRRRSGSSWNRSRERRRAHHTTASTTGGVAAPGGARADRRLGLLHGAPGRDRARWHHAGLGAVVHGAAVGADRLGQPRVAPPDRPGGHAGAARHRRRRPHRRRWWRGRHRQRSGRCLGPGGRPQLRQLLPGRAHAGRDRGPHPHLRHRHDHRRLGAGPFRRPGVAHP